MCPCNANNNNSSSSRVRLPTPQNIQNALIHIHTLTQAATISPIQLVYKTVLYQTQAGSYFEYLNHSFRSFIYLFFLVYSSRFDIFYALLTWIAALSWLGTIGTVYFGYFGHNLFRTFMYFFPLFFSLWFYLQCAAASSPC